MWHFETVDRKHLNGRAFFATILSFEIKLCISIYSFVHRAWSNEKQYRWLLVNYLCERRSIFPNSLTSMQIPKKRLCASATQTSTSRSLRCYTTLRNLRQIFWVHVGLTLLSSRMGRSPGASNMGDQRSAEANINLIHRNNGSNTKMTLKPYSAFSQAVNQSSSVPLPPDVSGHRSPFRQPLFRQSIV